MKQTRGLSRLQNDSRIQCQIDRERRSEQEGNGYLLHGRGSRQGYKAQMPNIQSKFKLRRNRDRFAASLGTRSGLLNHSRWFNSAPASDRHINSRRERDRASIPIFFNLIPYRLSVANP